MFAVIKTGGKQYRVAADDRITIEKLSAEAGDAVTFAEVLMVGDGDTATIGTPLVTGASVAGEVVEQTRGDKVRVFKKKRRKGYRRTAGHRQHLTVVRITDILTDGARKAAKTAAGKPDAKADEKAAETTGPGEAAEPKSAEKKAAEKEVAGTKATGTKATETKAAAKSGKSAKTGAKAAEPNHRAEDA